MDTKIWKHMRHWIKLPRHLAVSSKSIGKVDENFLQRLTNESFPESVIALHSTFNGFHQQWRIDSKDLQGNINILATKHFFDDTPVDLNNENIQWYLNANLVNLKGIFYPLDFFTDESCVGFFSNNSGLSNLYYYDFGATFYPLGINLYDYFILLDYTYGYHLWPRVLIALQNKEFQDFLEIFQRNMIDINPLFHFEDFKSLYLQVVDKTLLSDN